MRTGAETYNKRDLWKDRERALRELNESPTEEKLWRAIILFQEYPFRTVSGLPFFYKIKIGKSGEYTRELVINRRENSKTLTLSSVLLAFHRAIEKRGTVFTRPKGLVDCRGISYSFPILWKFGLIAVSEEIEAKFQMAEEE